MPGPTQTYDASMTLNAISTAGAATVSVSDPSTFAPGHLANGNLALPSPLQAKASSPGGTGGDFVPFGNDPVSLLGYAGPVSNDPVTVTFRQPIGAGDGLRTGTYSKTVTFTLTMQEGGPQALAVANDPDAVSVVAGNDLGFKVTVSNPTTSTAQSVTLADTLPEGGNLSWAVDAQSGIAGCAAAGVVGRSTSPARRSTCPRAPPTAST